MPQGTNIVVKNGAGVDKTFAFVIPSAGDKSMALWQLKEGSFKTLFPALQSQSQRNSSTKARSLEMNVTVPSSYTDSVTSLAQVGPKFFASIKVVVPDEYPEALKDDAVAYVTGLLSSALAKAMMRDAVSAT